MLDGELHTDVDDEMRSERHLLKNLRNKLSKFIVVSGSGRLSPEWDSILSTTVPLGNLGQ